VAVATVPISDLVAEALKANPESVRIAARTESGVQLVEGPKANDSRVTVRVDYVKGVDAAGRPVWPEAGVVHDYSPIDGLRR
jgi:hypothetical protein